MNNNYEVIKNIEKIKNGFSTKFLDNNMQNILKSKLRKNEYNIYYPYPDSEKVLFYKDELPKISLLEIISKDILKHQSILGSVFSLGLDQSTFGDIVLFNNHYYIFVLDEIKDYFINNLILIGRNKVKLEERNLNILSDYKREFDNIEIISSSERIDSVISHLINIHRNKIKDLIKDKDILINYEIVSNVSKKFIVGDIFSIRKYGKYKYLGIIKNTKSGNYIIKIDKYK